MTEGINTGGPAFPTLAAAHKHETDDSVMFASHEGMTLRQHYAGLAMQSVLLGCTADTALAKAMENTAARIGISGAQMVADLAVAYADALIAAEAKR